MSAAESNLHRLDGPDAVHQAVTIARAFGESHALRSDSAVRLAILIEELVYNLIDHGGPSAGDDIRLGLLRETFAVRIYLVDRGTPFDPRAAPDDAAIPDRGGGAGLALVRAWAKIVDYRSADGSNRLELILPLNPIDES